jgi:hypothetical protein
MLLVLVESPAADSWSLSTSTPVAAACTGEAGGSDRATAAALSAATLPIANLVIASSCRREVRLACMERHTTGDELFVDTLLERPLDTLLEPTAEVRALCGANAGEDAELKAGDDDADDSDNDVRGTAMCNESAESDGDENDKSVDDPVVMDPALPTENGVSLAGVDESDATCERASSSMGSSERRTSSEFCGEREAATSVPSTTTTGSSVPPLFAMSEASGSSSDGCASGSTLVSIFVLGMDSAVDESGASGSSRLRATDPGSPLSSLSSSDGDTLCLRYRGMRTSPTRKLPPEPAGPPPPPILESPSLSPSLSTSRSLLSVVSPPALSVSSSLSRSAFRAGFLRKHEAHAHRPSQAGL